jgi:hypothetical protein
VEAVARALAWLAGVLTSRVGERKWFDEARRAVRHRVDHDGQRIGTRVSARTREETVMPCAQPTGVDICQGERLRRVSLTRGSSTVVPIARGISPDSPLIDMQVARNTPRSRTSVSGTRYAWGSRISEARWSQRTWWRSQQRREIELGLRVCRDQDYDVGLGDGASYGLWSQVENTE